MIKKVLVLFVIFFSFSCETEKANNNVTHQMDDQGVVIAAPYIWKTSLHLQHPVSNSYIKHPIVFNGNIVVPTTDGANNFSLSMMSSKEGKILWKWDDVFEKGEYIDIAFNYQNNNLLIYLNGGRSYCVNLDNGSTKWRIRLDRSFDVRINSFDNYFFVYANSMTNNGFNEVVSFKGDSETGIISEFITANYSFDCHDCMRGMTHINQVPNHKNRLVVTYNENLPDWITQSYFGLYDVDLQDWVWDKMMIAPPKRENYPYHPPEILNSRIYAEIANSIVCHDLVTGKQLWKRDFTNGFMFSGFIIEDGRLIANNEDCFTVCLDPDTGNELWRVKTAGTCSIMSYLNGIVYFVGGSVPRFFAIEASTGKIVWKIDAALLGESYGAQFRTNAVYVLPAKDDQPAKVVALSNLYAYCFEAYR